MPRCVPTGTPAGRDGVDATGLDAAFRGTSSTQIPILWPHNCHWVCKTGHPESSCWSLRSTAQIQTFTSLPYTHLFTHGFRGIIHTYLYLQVLQIKQIQKHSSTKIPLQLTSRDVTTIHPNTLCSPKKLEEKIYDHQKHKLYVKFIM